jgi:hypothetical protein
VPNRELYARYQPSWSGVVVDHDRVAVPQPAIDVRVVPRRDAEEEATEPEAPSVSSFEVELAVLEAVIETAVGEGMIEVIVAIVAARIMSDPPIIAVNMRRIRMARRVAKATVLLRGAPASLVYWIRAVLGNVSSADTVHSTAAHMSAAAPSLRVGWNSACQHDGQ